MIERLPPGQNLKYKTWKTLNWLRARVVKEEKLGKIEKDN